MCDVFLIFAKRSKFLARCSYYRFRISTTYIIPFFLSLLFNNVLALFCT